MGDTPNLLDYQTILADSARIKQEVAGMEIPLASYFLPHQTEHIHQYATALLAVIRWIQADEILYPDACAIPPTLLHVAGRTQVCWSSTHRPIDLGKTWRRTGEDLDLAKRLRTKLLTEYFRRKYGKHQYDATRPRAPSAENVRSPAGTPSAD